jgi:SHS2 domain-containing protein
MYEIIKKTHTGDIRLFVKATSLEELFKAGMMGLFNEICGEFYPDSLSNEFSEIIEISSIDRTTLLIDFLSDLLALSQIHQVIFFDLNFLHIEDYNLKAEVIGMGIEQISEEIKAVTYHEANIVETGEMWSTFLVFDI